MGEPVCAEWAEAVPSGYLGTAPWVEWVHATWPAEGDSPRTIWLRVPGKWERRVRVWRQTMKYPWDGGVFSTLGCEALCVEDDDGCPLSRGPVMLLRDFVPSGEYLERTELAGLEWRPHV